VFKSMRKALYCRAFSFFLGKISVQTGPLVTSLKKCPKNVKMSYQKLAPPSASDCF